MTKSSGDFTNILALYDEVAGYVFASASVGTYQDTDVVTFSDFVSRRSATCEKNFGAVLLATVTVGWFP